MAKNKNKSGSSSNNAAEGKKQRSLFGSFCSFLFKVVIPGIVLSLAIFVGWLNTHNNPEGVFFASIIPLMKGHLPPSIVGHGKMHGTSTIPVPDDMTPQPRPEHEKFLMLPGDYAMPQAGLGMCCRPSAYDDELVYRTVLWYLLSGGRHIDGAHLYLNHVAIGRGIREAMRRGVPREEMFIVTKVWTRDFGYNSTKAVVPTFLEELGLEYVDLVLMHAPSHMFPAVMNNECNERKISNTECRKETFKALSEAREAGITRNIGVSNFFMKHLKEIEDLRASDPSVAPIAVNEFQFNPFAPDFAYETYHYCQDNNIAVTAYSSLGGALQHFSSQTVDTLESIAKKYDTSFAQIALRWAIQKNIAVIPGTGNPKHMRENLGVYDMELTAEDMEALDKLRTDEQAKKFFYMEARD